MQYTKTIIHGKQASTPTDCNEHGSFSALSHHALLDTRSPSKAETTGTITLNCSGLEPINSHGIYLLILLLIYTKRQQKRLQVFGLSEYNKYIFEITRLNKFIDIVETETQALDALHQHCS